MRKNNKQWHETFKYYLKKKGHGTQARLARKFGKSSEYISLLSKEKRNPGKNLADEIAKYFGHTLRDFINIGNKLVLGEAIGEEEILSLGTASQDELIDKITQEVNKNLKTERLLQQTEKLYEGIVETQREMVLRLDRNGIITFANNAFEKEACMPRTEALGSSFGVLIGDTQFIKLWKKAQSLTPEQSFTIEVKGAITKRWRQLSILALGSTITNEYLVTVLDIHEKKKAEDTLKFIEYGVNMSGIPTFWTKENGDFAYVNVAALSHLGYTEEEFKNKHPWDLAIFLSKESWPAFFEKCTKAGSLTKQTEFTKNNGTTFPVDLQINNVKYPDGRRFNITFATPLTDKIKTEKELADQQAKFKSILDSIGDGISIQDRDFTIKYQNTAHIAMAGNHLGKKCYTSYEGTNSPCKDCPCVKVFEDGEIHKALRVSSNGESISITASPLKNSNGITISAIESIKYIDD